MAQARQYQLLDKQANWEIDRLYRILKDLLDRLEDIERRVQLLEEAP